MKNILTSILLLTIKLSFGQSLTTLDDLNGFQNFKLGNKLTVYKSVLKYNDTKDGITTYEHINPSKINFQQLDPERAFFDFYENELYGITLFINDYKALGYKRVIEELKILFGEPTEMSETLTGNIWITWKGNKTELLTQFFVKDNLICVEFKSVSIARKILTKKF